MDVFSQARRTGNIGCDTLHERLVLRTGRGAQLTWRSSGDQVLRWVHWSVFILVLSTTLIGQEAEQLTRKQAIAVRVGSDAIRLDGRLDEEAWRLSPALTDFIQKEPVEGATPTDRMEIRFVYSNDALFVGARMYSQSRGAIQAPLGRRDDGQQSEHLLVSLDTYLDRRTAYTFGVTASGVRLDHYHPSDNENQIDREFDPVWEARTRVDEGGWTAEMWIPFSQLRFNDLGSQVWGLNLKRWIPSRNEEVFWVPVPRTVQAWSSRFGELRGIEEIGSTRRIELLPYFGVMSTVTGDPDPANPFDDGRNLARRVGADVKMGLGPNLTLEATVNPDFGQVEADPAEVNLSAFETFFSERRPFFLEGSRLLNSRVVTNYFYSRRIGARPGGPASGAFVDFPRNSTILGAAKLSGRLASGTSVAFLGAVTDEEHAETFERDTFAFNRVRVAPLTQYGVATIEQEFGPAASTAGFMVTGLHRNLEPGDPLAARLARNAFSGSGDSLLRFKGGEYELRLQGGVTYVEGDPEAMRRLQRSSAHYFQRPDADHITLDPSRTTLVGYKGGMRLERTGGRHWLWSGTLDMESPEFETNDIGRLRAADGIQGITNLTYRETQPGRMFRNYSISVGTGNEWTYGWDRQPSSVQTNGLVTWHNFWTTNVSANVALRSQDWRLTRGGPSMGTLRGWTVSAQLSSSAAAQTGWDGLASYAQDEDGGLAFGASGGLSLRPGPRWQLSVNPSYTRQVDSRQYVTALERHGSRTFGRRYIFGFIDRSTVLAQVRLNYTFKPDLNLDVYAEPFASSGRYYNLGELEAQRSRHLRLYGSDSTTIERVLDGSYLIGDGADTFTLPNNDFNILSFRSNVVLRWEWRPGSTLFLVWQQDRSSFETRGDRIGAGNLFGSLSAPGDNFFVVKASFWISAR